jgi:hypothetical protein
MAKSRSKRIPTTVLELSDLEHPKSAVLNGLTSASSKRSYDRAIREFIDWYCSEPRLGLPRTVVTRYRIALDQHPGYPLADFSVPIRSVPMWIISGSPTIHPELSHPMQLVS